MFYRFRLSDRTDQLIAFELQRAWEITGATLGVVHPIVQYEVLITRNATLRNRSVGFIKDHIYVSILAII